MTDLDIKSQNSLFGNIRHVDDQGQEYWVARELMPLLGYTQWRRFKDSIERAIQACQNVGNDSTHHIATSDNVVKRSHGGGSSQQDYKLSRYGCYLIAMNGDPRKPEIAAAQTYFAIKTREAEIVIPKATETIEQLKLQLEIERYRASAEQSKSQAEQATLKRLEKSQAIATMHGPQMLALIQGRPDAIVTQEKVVERTICIDPSGQKVASFDGVGITYIQKMLGFKTTKQTWEWLESVDMGKNSSYWIQEIVPQSASRLPREFLGQVQQKWSDRQGTRQMLLGENE